MNLLHDQSRSAIARNAGMLTVMALAAVAIGLLMGFGAIDLYESATEWVLLV